MKHLPSPVFRVLKTTLLAVFINVTSMLHAQNNTTCQTAATLNPVLECNNSQSFIFGNGQTEQWFSFNTGADQFFILEYSINSTNYKYSVDLYSGNCNSNTLIQSDTLANYIFLNELYYEYLDSNTQYYIKIIRLSNSNFNDTLGVCLNNKKILEPDFEACITIDPLSNIFGWCCAPMGVPIELCSWEESGIGCYNTPFTVKSNYGGAGVRIVWTLPGAVIIKDWVGNNSSLAITNYTIPSGFFPPGSGNWVLTGVTAEYFKNDGFGNYYPLNKKISITFSVTVPHAPPHFEMVGEGPFCMGDEVCFDFYSNNTVTKNIFTTKGIFEPYIPFFPYPDPVINSHTGGIGILTETKCYQYLSPGIYTPTLSSGNDCGTVSKTLTLEIGPYPKFEVPEPLCAGQEFTFNNTTACLQYVQSWFWDFGDGFSSTQANPSHIYTNPGTYTVELCLIDANGQPHCIQQQVTVHPSPAPPVILGNLYTCDPNPEFCVQNPQPGYTYTWNITNGLPQSYTGNCVEVNWNQNTNGFITVIATNQFGCISVTDVEVAQCCFKEDLNNPGTEINLYNTTASFIINNILGGSTTWTTNTYINLNGVMEIDQDFTFSNCPNIYLGQNARINIPAGKKLRIENASKLEAACPDKMWDGIYLQTYTSQLETDFSTFMHAQNAIVSQNGAKYTITSSTFNQNWIGIKVEPFSFNHPGIVTAGTFGPTSFLCTAPLMYPHLDKRSHAGIYIQQVGNQNGSITVGHSVLFDNQNTGVLAEASNVLVKGCVFQNMGIVQGQGGGIGVHTKGGDLGAIKTTVGGLPSNTNNFNNCFTGVLIEHWQDAEVSYNNFTGTNTTAVTGIRVQHITKYGQPIPYKNITIKNNTITNYQTGINLYSNMNAIVLVQKNNINQQGVPFGSGIIAQEMPISITFNLTTIAQNNIIAPASGIVAGGLRNVQISENDVTKLKQNNLFNTYGVLLRGCFNARVSSNNVSSQNPSSNTRQHGYAFEMSEATFATCNEADKTGTGMRCAGAMPNSFILGNTFKNNYHGFTMSNNAIIGEQYRIFQGTKYPSDNRWQGSFNSRSVANDNINPNKNLSPFYVRSISGNNPFYPNAGVLAQDTLARILLIKNPPLLCDKILSPGIKKGISQQIAKKQILLSDTTSVIGRIQVFESLQQNYTWQPDAILAQFADSMQATSYRALQLIDSIMFDTAQCKVTLLNSCQSIVPQNHVEQHIQNASEIYISSRVNNNGIYTPQQISDLEYIAWLCPFDDGQGVYLARFLLQEVSNTEYLNSCEDATGNNLRISGNEQEDETMYGFIENKEKISVYPNPANETFSVELDQEREIQIEVFDMLGKRVASQYSNSKYTKVAIVNLPTGLYLVKIRTGETEENYKINVQH
ncbi:MAG: T9SS type A sorting domain-containing protein [Flavobacteriales bacterium]|nr:T9SS type A sorting domain-containing protein [Flavobacteriales bacterium]